MAKTNQNQPLATSAAGQYYGYGLQTVRACYYMLVQPTGYISVESFEDVGVRTASGEVIAEQVKSALSGKNPIADRNPNLWKTFANWVAAVQGGHLDAEKTHFRLYIGQRYSGQWVKKLSDARDKKQAQVAITELKSALEARGSYPAEVERHLNFFLSANSSVQQSIVANFTFEAGSGDPMEEIRGRLVSVHPAVVEDVIRAALGWVKSRIDGLIAAHYEGEVHAEEFITWLHAYIRKHDRDHILACVSAAPAQEHITQELGFRVYIRQLEIIESDAEEKVQAASDFLQAAADRTAWSVRGCVLDEDLNRFEEDLIVRWRSTRRTVQIAHCGCSEADRGKLLYHESVTSECRLTDGRPVPRAFLAGSLHRLADSLDLGWHPRYEEVLDGKEE